MEFISSNASDIDKYYNGTYVKFKEFGDRLFLIRYVHSHEVGGKDEDDNLFKLHLDDDFPYTVDYVLPHKAIFSYKDTLCLLQRIPARQYKKGLCQENTQIINLINGDKLSIGFALLKEFVGKKAYLSFTQAFNSKGKARGVALSSRMWYNRENSRIMIDRNMIGVYEEATKTINLLNACFLDEINEHMLNNNETYKVVTP